MNRLNLTTTALTVFNISIALIWIGSGKKDIAMFFVVIANIYWAATLVINAISKDS
jgi:hypothetical protein